MSSYSEYASFFFVFTYFFSLLLTGPLLLPPFPFYPISDWIALNVLRSVALSTNSVAASVEPVIQQQFFTLSPMQGQDAFGGAAGPSGTTGHSIMNETPTTSSMLAALHDTFGANTLDTGAPDSFMTMGFGDPSVTVSHHDGGNTMFGDYGAGTPFDVPSFTPQELGLSDASSVHSHSSAASVSGGASAEREQASPESGVGGGVTSVKEEIVSGAP